MILCGGGGERLWPVSRRSRPKQFAPSSRLVAEAADAADAADDADAESLLQRAIRRFGDRRRFAPPILSASSAHRAMIEAQADALGESDSRLLLEPRAMGTGPAILLAALAARRDGASDDDALIVAPSDHVIGAPEAWSEAFVGVADSIGNRIAVFGVAPSSPSTEFGYLELGDRLSEDSRLRRLSGFHEKPDEATARAYVAQGRLWNSGHFLARIGTLIEEYGRLDAATSEAASEALAEATESGRVLLPSDGAYRGAVKESFDRAVMERTSLGAAAEGDASWSDAGTWDAIWRHGKRHGRRHGQRHGRRDSDDNAVLGGGETSAIETVRTLMSVPSGFKAAAVGVSDLAIVLDGDGLLVADRRRPDLIREASRRFDVGEIESSESRIDKPWGWYRTLSRGDGFLVKRLVVRSGGLLSSQSHRFRSEHWLVVRGVAEATVGERTESLRAGESLDIPLGARHRLANRGEDELEIVEIQLGVVLDEDDIERYEDVYGRV